tara:strand:- start:355 stop:1329 length:975 start_codon:yes stop_codon:yes gene_type:complete
MKIAINGLGRIGRAVLKIGLEQGVNFVAVNDLTPIENLAYLLKYDTVYGVYDKSVSSGRDYIKIGNKKIKILAEPNPEKLPWKKLGVDAVVESTGLFTDRENAKKHLKAGSKKVLISAPAENPDITIVPGVNDNLLKQQKIISVASCTTNALAPVVKVLNDEYGIKKGFFTTVHAYTSTQNIVDGPNKKLRRGRAAAANIIPTTTGASKAVIEVIPELKGKLEGLAMRVPVVSGSIIDVVVELNSKPTKEQVNNLFKKQAKKLKGIIDYTEDELVSSDTIGNTHSSIIDGLSTQALGNMVKVLSWYDNEYGYSCRMVDVLKSLK